MASTGDRVLVLCWGTFMAKPPRAQDPAIQQLEGYQRHANLVGPMDNEDRPTLDCLSS